MRPLIFILIFTLNIFFCLKIEAQEYRRKAQRERELLERPRPVKPKPTAPPADKNEAFLSGKVVEAITGEPIAGAYIKQLNTLNGTVANSEGEFSLKLTYPATLEFSAVGYGTKTIMIINASLRHVAQKVELRNEEVMTDVVVVSASRVEERLLTSPITVTKMNLDQIRSRSTLNPIDGMGAISQLDIATSSFGIKNINARGFNTANNQRFVHRVDGMEMLSPALGFYMGSLASWATQDLESIEIIAGPASALYGTNSLNGMFNLYTKNPFDYQGLSVSLKSGFTRLGNPSINENPLTALGPRYELPYKKTSAAPFGDIELRFAQALNSKWAYKITAAYLMTEDWIANDYRDQGIYIAVDNEPGLTSGGYDGINMYGDEIAGVVSGQPTGGSRIFGYRVARTGFREQDLANYNTKIFNSGVSFHFRPNNKQELILYSRQNINDCIFQASNNNRYELKQLVFIQTKAEWKSPNYFIRLYNNTTGGRNGYDLAQTGQRINSLYKPHQNWITQYMAAKIGEIDMLYNSLGLPPIGSDEISARRFADQDNTNLIPYLMNLPLTPEQIAAFNGGRRYEPGTPEFDQALETVKSKNLNKGGSGLITDSQLWHAEGQYDLSSFTKPYFDFQVGGNYRYSTVNTKNTMYPDSADRIQIREFGIFGQVSRKLLEDRLRLQASLRLDGHSNFKSQWSPRLSAVYALDPKDRHILRANYQTAFRYPSVLESYLDLSDGAFTRTIGSLEEIHNRYDLKNNSYNLVNVLLFDALERLEDTTTAIQILGKPISPKTIQPERIRSFELGYRGLLTDKLYFDLSTFYSRYHNFIDYNLFVGPHPRDVGSHSAALNLSDLRIQNYNVYALPQNISTYLEVWGASPSISYSISSKYRATATYTWMDFYYKEKQLEDFFGIEAFFNTPKNKVGIGLQGIDVWRNLGFQINYRWNDAFYYDGFPIQAYTIMDTQISYRMTKWKTILSIGANNLLNYYHVEILGGPRVGGTYFFQISYDSLLN